MYVYYLDTVETELKHVSSLTFSSSIRTSTVWIYIKASHPTTFCSMRQLVNSKWLVVVYLS